MKEAAADSQREKVLLLALPIIATWIIGWSTYAVLYRRHQDHVRAGLGIQRAAAVYVPLLLLAFAPLIITRLRSQVVGVWSLYATSSPLLHTGAGVGLGAVMAAVTIAYVRFIERRSGSSVARYAIDTSPAFRILDAIGLVLVAPVLEELFFRGYGWEATSDMSLAAAAVITSVAFALWHANPMMMPAAFIIGLIFFGAYAWTATLLVPTIGHALANAVFWRMASRR